MVSLFIHAVELSTAIRTYYIYCLRKIYTLTKTNTYRHAGQIIKPYS